MKKSLVIIISLFMLNCLFADNQVEKKAASDIINKESKRLTTVVSIHSMSAVANNSLLPAKPASPNDINYPIVNSFSPNWAWWYDSNRPLEGKITLTGSNFSAIPLENRVHFYPVPAQPESANATVVTVRIPEGARSSQPIVSNSGISGLTQSNPSLLQIVAPLTFSYIRSVVEDRNNHSIYVGYDDSEKPKIVKINLYQTTPTYEFVDGYPYSAIRPYLTRMATDNAYQHEGEICYIRENAQQQPEIWCVKNGSSPYIVANLYDNGFNAPVRNVVAFDSTPDGVHFFVADWTEGLTQGHIIHVQWGNPTPINPNWGWANPPYYVFNFFTAHRRTGLAAYYDANYFGYPTVQLSTDNKNYTCLGETGAGSCIWEVHETFSLQKNFYADKHIQDIEVDRLISLTEPTPYATFFYFIDGGVATLASDLVHDYRGFVDAVNNPLNPPPSPLTDEENPIWDSLLLNINTTSYIKPYNNWRPVNNQNEIVISQNPQIDIYPHPAQDISQWVKITVRGFAYRHYCLRVLDPKDQASYPANPVPNVNAGARCVADSQTPPGPFLSACDNINWNDNQANQQAFGLCEHEGQELCPIPARILDLYMGTPCIGCGQSAQKDVYLKLPTRAINQLQGGTAGDNLIVQLSELPFGYPAIQECIDTEYTENVKQPVDAYSGIYTGWKRIAMEYDSMYRYGAPLRQSLLQSQCTTDQSCNRLFIYRWTGMSTIDSGDMIWVYTRPWGNTDPDPDCPGATLPGSKCETATIVSNPQNVACPDGLHGDRCWQIMLDHQLTKDYNAAYVHPNYNLPDFTNQNSAAIALYHRYTVDCTDDFWKDYCFFKKSLTPEDFGRTFNNAFTFFAKRDNGSGAIPFLPNYFAVIAHDDLLLYSAQWSLFSRIWFYNCSDANCDNSNYLHFMGAGDGEPYYFGNSYSLHNWSYIFIKTIEATTWPNNVLIETTNHELAHMFDVDPCDQYYHDDEIAWCSGQDGCKNTNHDNIEWSLMHVGRCNLPGPPPPGCEQEEADMRMDGIDELQLMNYLSGILVESCVNGSRSFVHGDGAIRTYRDPL